VLDTSHAGAAPCALTLLTSDKSASKIYTAMPNGSYPKFRDFDLSLLLQAESRDIADLGSLYTLLDDIRSRGDVVIVRGELDEAFYTAKQRNRNYKIARRKNDKGDGIPAHLTEASRRWVMWDVDKYPLPPDANLAIDPVGIIDAAIRNVLPEEFHDAKCIWQLSNSAGLVPGVLKAHLFFWLDTPWPNDKLRKWIKLHARHLDTAPFSANQPHYVCDPVIRDLDGRPAPDPLPARLGWRPGTHDVVALPPLIETPKAARKPRSARAIGRSATPGMFAADLTECLAKLGDGPGLDGFHAPLLAAGIQYARRCAKGARRDDEAYFEKINAAIEAAPRRPDRSESEISKYLDGAYHKRVIDGPFRWIEQSKPAGADEFPPGFGMTHTGLWHTPIDKKGNEQDPIWVCAPFSVIGMCASDVGEAWGLVIEWQDGNGHDHRWIVDRAIMHGDAPIIAAQLEDKGLVVNIGAQNPLKRCLALLRPKKHQTAMEKGGWQGDAFILPNGDTIGGTADVFMRSETAKKDLGSAQQGTLAEWNSHIGRYCVGNSRLGLFISAAFAGPLLDIIHEPSGGLHLHGDSQKGKTTGAYTSGSVWGKGARGGKVQQWRSTPNALESVAARSNDGLLVMDELSQSEAAEAGVAAYMLANEQGKSRMTKTITLREPLTWRLIFVSTGEVTLAQRMGEAGKKPQTGMEVRLIDIKMDGGAGMGLFENTHDFASPGAFSDHLRDASATYYGTPIRAFLERLVELRSDDPDGLADFIKGYRSNFIADHVPDGADGQVRSVAGRFGVLPAAGEMAITFGVLDWPEGEAERACIRCFQDWLAARGTIGSGEAQKGISQVRRFIESHGNSRFQEIRAGALSFTPNNTFDRDTGKRKPVDENEPVEHLNDSFRITNQAGYRKYDSEAKQWSFMFSPEVWKSEVCAGLDAEQVAKAMQDKAWLDHESGRLTKRVRIPKQEKLVRLYVVSGDILAA
jgi:uncharacterized protein (DUF927 family)